MIIPNILKWKHTKMIKNVPKPPTGWDMWDNTSWVGQNDEVVTSSFLRIFLQVHPIHPLQTEALRGIDPSAYHEC
jgi:hypothetical protein